MKNNVTCIICKGKKILESDFWENPRPDRVACLSFYQGVCRVLLPTDLAGLLSVMRAGKGNVISVGMSLSKGRNVEYQVLFGGGSPVSYLIQTSMGIDEGFSALIDDGKTIDLTVWLPKSGKCKRKARCVLRTKALLRFYTMP